MALGKKGGLVDVWRGRLGGGEKLADDVSSSRISVRERGFSQAGGRIFARRCRLRRRASHNGRGVR